MIKVWQLGEALLTNILKSFQCMISHSKILILDLKFVAFVGAKILNSWSPVKDFPSIKLLFGQRLCRENLHSMDIQLVFYILQWVLTNNIWLVEQVINTWKFGKSFRKETIKQNWKIRKLDDLLLFFMFII